MRKTIFENKSFYVDQVSATRRGVPHKQKTFTIYARPVFSLGELEEVRNFIDPQRNISGRNGTRWKFKKRSDVEKIWVWLSLRYS